MGQKHTRRAQGDTKTNFEYEKGDGNVKREEFMGGVKIQIFLSSALALRGGRDYITGL